MNASVVQVAQIRDMCEISDVRYAIMARGGVEKHVRCEAEMDVNESKRGEGSKRG